MPLLFSYGTLQHDEVQISLFGRLLQGQVDELVGFEQLPLRINDPRFEAADDPTVYSIVLFTGQPDRRVRGMVFEMSEAELVSADGYEPAPYRRVATTLASGKTAWVYAV